MPGSPEESKAIYSARTGAIRAKDLACILFASDNLEREALPNTILSIWDAGVLGGELLKYSLLSVCVAKVPKEQSVAIDEYGRVYVIGSGEELEERIVTPTSSPETRLPLREVREIGGKAYAVGMGRQVYRRDGPSSWVALDGDMSKAPAADPVFGFESIHGGTEEDMYAVGWHGEIWHHGKQGWKQVPSPTNVLLTRVFCAPDGNVYACGRRGMLLRGKGSRWEVVEHGKTEDDFWDLQWFEGKLYLSTGRLLYTLEGDTIEPVDMGKELAESCYHLDAADGVLWSIAAKDILQFDGKDWTRIL